MTKTNTPIIGVILAAGRGTRFEPLSGDVPKAMMTICNKPIIQYQIGMMIKLGIRDFVLVVGYLREKIEEYLGDGSSMDIHIRYLEQTQRLGIAHAVGQLEDHIDKPFLLFLGDIFFIPRELHKMIEIFNETQAEAVLAVKPESDSNLLRKNFTVTLLTGTNRVKRVIEKPYYLTTNLKGCGIYLMNLSIFDAIRNTPRTAMRDEYEITSSIQILIAEDAPVFVADVIDWDMNITVPCDLWKCNLKWLVHNNQPHSIHPSAQLAKDTQVINSVIGKGAVISQPITIQNSVILEGSIINSSSDISNQLISPDFNFACPDLKDLKD